MRVELETPTIETRPLRSARASIRVHNTTDVIDGIKARAIGLDPSAVKFVPDSLPLFPGADGTIDFNITLPRAFPAGEHVLTFEVTSSAQPELVEYVDLQVLVDVEDDISLAIRPQAITGKKRTEFAVHCRNDGNQAVELTLVASDQDHVLRHKLEPPFVVIGPGEEVISTLRVEGRRPLSGQNANRRIMVTGVAPDRQLTAEAMFSQRPIIRRGPVTFGVLASIIGLWAVLFTLAINNAVGSEPATKEFPARSLEAIGVALAADEAIPGAAAARLGADVIGGTVTGQVRALSNNEPVGRITVEAIRLTKDGSELATTAATGEDGTFELTALASGRYKLHFTAPGFEDIWYPSAPSEESASEIRVNVGGTLEALDMVIEGVPGGIVGSVDTGDGLVPVPVTVTARVVVDGAVAEVVAETTTDDLGTYALPELSTPAVYDLSFTAPGFEPAHSQERLDGGEIGVANTIRMSAGAGSISGLVTGGGQPLGGVQITALSGSEQRATATPTSGAIGVFDLGDLPTPGTYVITFVLDGYGTQTVAIELGPGEARFGVNVDMVGGTGTVTGTVLGPDDKGIGDATVAVTGGPSEAETTTLTAGTVGGFRLTGLPTPGTYTLTVSAPGYRSETISVNLSSNGSADGLVVKLSRSIGSIAGKVVDSSDNRPVSGAEIAVTDGSTEKSGRSASVPAGQFSIGGLGSGAWSLTFTAPGYRTHTVLVNLDAGQELTIDDVKLVPVATSTTVPAGGGGAG